MKKSIESLLIAMAKHDVFWKFLRPLSTVGKILAHSRWSNEKEKKMAKSSKYESLFHSLTVLNGPFQGLKYPSLESVGSALYPKLLGSYERELHPTLSKIADEVYSEILDIGCAEGYYAIGLARKYARAQVHAFDVEKKARNLCLQMAKLNGVADRLEIHSACSKEFLKTFVFTQKGLILCDCEGFENELFGMENINNLNNCDLIIEVHDFIDIEISSRLKRLFSKSHSIESVYSLDDIHKAQTYDFHELSNLSLKDKMSLLSEHRPAIMEWIVCKRKKSI